jgi:SAM-dependent methyltransferase
MTGVTSVPDHLSERKNLVRQHFALQARSHARTPTLFAEKAQAMLDLARPEPEEAVLDVACGWGFVALAFAPFARSIIGVDLTPEMVDLARTLAREGGFSNVEYQRGDLEALPFGSGTFDLVTCRAAFDHLGNPQKALGEMKRVLAPSGRIVLYEFVAPALPEKAALYNKIERSRDPSHLRSLTVDEFRTLIRTCGLEERGKVVNLLKRDFEAWMSVAGAGDAEKQTLRSLLLDSIKGDQAGLAPRLQGGKLTFTHTCVAWLLTPGA